MNTHIRFLKNFDAFFQKSPIIFLGPESFPLERIKENYRERGYSIATIYLDETELEEVRRQIHSRSMFSDEKRVFLLRNFLSNRRWKELIEERTEDILLFYDRFSDEEDERKLSKKALEWYRINFGKSKREVELVLMPYLKPEERIKWLMGRARKMGISLDAEKARSIVDRGSPDLYHLQSELEKIALAGVEHMEDILFSMKEESIFQMTDALLEKNTEKILDILETREPIPALAFIAKSLLNSIYASSGVKERVKPSFMAVRFAKMGKLYYTKEMYRMLLETLKTERAYKTFHRGRVALYKLAGELTK